MRRHVLAVVALVAAFVLPVPAAAGAQAAPGLVTTQVDGVTVTTSVPITTSQALHAFVLSATPKAVEVDLDTGGLVSVTEVVATTVTPFVSVSASCGTGAACLVSGSAPLSDVGFSGSAGTVTGTWASRITWRTGGHTAQAWYRHPTTGATTSWGGTLGPNSVVSVGTLVTGLQVRLY